MSANQKAAIEDRSYHIYLPILKSRQDYDLPKFDARDLTNKVLCCYVLLEPKIPSLGNLVRVYYDASGNTPFRLTRSADAIVFSFSDDLFKDLESGISSATGLPAKVSQVGQ